MAGENSAAAIEDTGCYKFLRNTGSTEDVKHLASCDRRGLLQAPPKHKERIARYNYELLVYDDLSSVGFHFEMYG